MPFSFFKKKKATTNSVVRPIIGITDAEYLRISDALNQEYEDACKRQKLGSKKPSGYMKGLKRAIEIVLSVEPHVLSGGN